VVDSDLPIQIYCQLQPLKKGDNILINFGLHDYNLGLAGVPEYKAEYRRGLGKVVTVADATGAKILILGTTPAHNTAKTADDVTVVALNKVAQQLAAEMGLGFVDLHSPLIERCGPVPWADNGTAPCSLCAPRCKALSVHYDKAGYTVIASLIKARL
jgi:lysophospholipase L1-like esterase